MIYNINMVPRDIFKKILDKAVHAPSGDNSQPWRFSFDNDSILIFNIENRDPTLYNFRQRGSYVSHGAVIENIAIIAGALGYRVRIEAFPEGETCTAKIMLEPSSTTSDVLCDAILERSTNRKPYRREALDPDHKRVIFDSAKAYQDISLKLVEDKDQLKALAQAISLNEQLVMENRPLHDFLFSIIRWSKREEERAPGLYIKTMEFPLPQRLLLRLVRHWPFVRAFNMIGFSRLVPKGSSQLYASSSGIGAIILKNDSNASFLHAGRIFQRIWLTATHLGLAIQPIAAMPYLAQRVAAGEADVFSPQHQGVINRAYTTISHIFELRPGEDIAMIFRIGYADAPSARSMKRAPEITDT